jgi:hypothetical protein
MDDEVERLRLEREILWRSVHGLSRELEQVRSMLEHTSQRLRVRVEQCWALQSQLDQARDARTGEDSGMTTTDQTRCNLCQSTVEAERATWSDPACFACVPPEPLPERDPLRASRPVAEYSAAEFADAMRRVRKRASASASRPDGPDGRPLHMGEALDEITARASGKKPGEGEP